MTDDRAAVQEVLARYVRATDQRDGKAQGALFTDDAIVQVYTKVGSDSYRAMGDPIIGGAGVRYAVENYLAPHPAGGSSHHVTADHIVEVCGDEAHLNAQFIVFEVRALAEPDDGWPADAVGPQGTIWPAESGYYDTDLRRVDGRWKIVHLRGYNDMNFAFHSA